MNKIKLDSWFAGKKCKFCGEKAEIFRFHKHNSHTLCKSAECDFKSNVFLGLENNLIIKNNNIVATQN